MHDVNYHRYQQAKRVTIVGIVITLLLSIFKLIFGLAGHSAALVADGVHSLSDLMTDIMVLLAARAASQGPDADHPYGHERIETIATVALALFLVIVGISIAYEGVHNIWMGHYGRSPAFFVLIVAAISIVANEFLFRYTLRTAKQINSALLKANAWHSRSDALSSIVVLIGAGATMMGLPFMDSLAAIVVAIMVIKMGGQMAWENVLELVDTGGNEERKAAILAVLQQTPGVTAVHELRTRTMAGKYVIDAHLQVNPRITVSEGHFIADHAYVRLHQTFDDIKDITIHIDPEDDIEGSHPMNLPDREQLLAAVKPYWQSLAGWAAYHCVRLDYLSNQLDVTVSLPLSVLTKGVEASVLQQQYQRAVASLPFIANVYLTFQL